MRQYWDIKAAHEDKVLLFRMGDFFEMFFDDAIKAAPILGIALTQRNKKSADETPMCGVPAHSIAGPINKLLKVGLKVAVCDQVEDPKLAKGLVKRAVTRVLTPGMVYDPETLDQSLSNYLACWDQDVLACLETSTGEGFYFSDLDLRERARLLAILPIAEMVLGTEEEKEKLAEQWSGLISLQKDLTLMPGTNPSIQPRAVFRLISYVQSLGGEEALKTTKPFEKRLLQKRLDLSATVLRHLEIFSTYKGEGPGSFYTAIDRTKTSAGARLMRSWISFPLTDLEEILNRQTRVSSWVQDMAALKRVREVLAQLGDIERRLGKIAQPQCNGRDLLALAHSVQAGLSALQVASSKNKDQGLKLSEAELQRLALDIEKTLVEEPPLLIRQGHMIRQGVSAELDELIVLATDSHSLLQKMELEEKQKTGIQSLKIRYNSVFGYYIEVTNTHREKVPAHYMRKQTLTNAERYCTEELIELEKKVLSAQARRAELEYALFEGLRQQALAKAQELLHLSGLCSELDVVAALAWLALEKRYCLPQFHETGIILKSSRHPVVEQAVKTQFVANDIELTAHGCLLLTGPNMAGKSTLMRQVALTVILAQMGSYVPASEARLPIFDHLFTRIGASDQLSEGLSTFMVEMTETAEMLEKSSDRSLLILDEIGRGTSTYDGMSLAQAILEYLLQAKKATSLFATHYHELTGLESNYAQLKNAHMTVVERNGEVRFLHTLKSGPAQKSYGIQVAKLAGLPGSVTERALELLKTREKTTPAKNESSKSQADHGQMSLLDIPVSSDVAALQERWDQVRQILGDMKSFPVTNKTPIEALNQVAEWQKSLRDETLS
ncbi:MAG: DNA mismatch repair protein MutS [Bdellovibrio sp. CG10_big_fil_rev_8_21_14_0_10_47_8]|nr:MAG: DNA mismatch repair protein MutS [Bdellovibrio sp. CG10_big_fil_rev_8_21_14_0_10_47_8]